MNHGIIPGALIPVPTMGTAIHIDLIIHWQYTAHPSRPRRLPCAAMGTTIQTLQLALAWPWKYTAAHIPSRTRRLPCRPLALAPAVPMAT